MRKLVTLTAVAGVALAGSSFVAPMQINAANPVEECSKELLLSYYPDPFVRDALKKFNVPEDKWDSIVKELNVKDKEIVKTVEEKASKMNPNPLKDPQQRQAAVKIFKETLLDAFSSVLKKNGINDDAQIQQILDEVQQQKAKRFAECMEKQRPQSGQSQPSANPLQGKPQASADQSTPATKPATAAPQSGDATKSNPSGSSDDSSDDDDEF